MIPTSNHNSDGHSLIKLIVVYLLIPTSNHNQGAKVLRSPGVVYLLIPTSNHNHASYWVIITLLYIFWFLHQTTTDFAFSSSIWCCISFDSYIKPQLRQYPLDFDSVVYLLIPTSNHNCTSSLFAILLVVYLLIPTSNHNYDWYIKFSFSVVYLLIPTSNHNFSQTFNVFGLLYIFWFLHQTTTYRFESTDFQCIPITFSNKKWRVEYNYQCKSTKKTPIE